jgi:predicted membrane-bound spermidine synthase/Na+-translocating ferredoxin:NAD+ oxidoreductase RnfG subunit
MRFARGLLIFSYGLFTIAAQTLLFRDFLTSFEGNDISVGVFFGSWFLWVGLGAILVYKATGFAEKLLNNIEFVFLSYIPAFILQLILIIQARELSGVEAHALLPIWVILLLPIIVNAPVSVITGVLFPLACRWGQDEQKGDVSRVYIIEAAGSFVGGLGATILLGLGISPATVFFMLAIIVSLSVFVVRIAKAIILKTHDTRPKMQNLGLWLKGCGISFLILLSFCILLAIGADKTLARYVREVRWTKLLPKDAFRGSFQTAQAEYLYGVYQNQWVAIREGGVCEALPNKSAAGQIAAISLCQNPDAESVLVVGSGLGVCYEFLHLPQIKTVTWAHCDSEYAQKIDHFIEPQFKVSSERFRRINGDVRTLLSREKRYYDIVIVNLPEATSSVLNRYYTLQFYHQVKESLRQGGVLAVRVAGGENIMGTELINLGASTKLTLQKVFPRLVITPGEDTWFIASDSKNLTGDPAALRDRFAAIKGAAEGFSPQALLSVYLPVRAAKAMENYSAADLPEGLLVNSDSRPLTNLYSLLLAAKQSGAPVTRFVKCLALAGPLAFLIPVLVFVVLRAVYVLKTDKQGGKSSFDSSFLVFSAGWLGIGVVIVLMYLYQTLFGSLYLHIGVISSLFMVGLTVGAVVTRHLLGKTFWKETRKVSVTEVLLVMVVLIHILILAGIAFWPAGQWSRSGAGGVWEPTHLIFAIAFVLCGLCSGCYFPIAATGLADLGFEQGQAGSKLETADHIGASLGGALTGLVLVPVFGTRATLLVFVVLILANLPLAGLKIFWPERISLSNTTVFRLRRLGYILLGVGVSVVVCSNLLAGAGASLMPSLPHNAAQALAGTLSIERASAALGSDARKVSYFTVRNESGDVNGYIFSSEELSPEARGFGGKMNIAIYVDASGRLINFHIIRSNETPSYLSLLGQWRERLGGRQLFGPQPFAGIDAVTGATISSKAILSALETSGQRFAAQVLGRSMQPEQQKNVRWAGYLPDARGIYLIGAFVLALIVTYRGGFWSRLGVLVVNLIMGGVILNAQYSSEQIASLLSMDTPALGLTGVFLLVVVVPFLVIVFGNMYCGYICPFGVAQELLGYIVPTRFRQPIAIEKMQKARFVKYCVLFVFIMVFFLSRNRATLAADPLISVFGFRFSISGLRLAFAGGIAEGGWIWLIVALALAGAIFYPRFWCRYLCPVGAFLSLFNNVVILKKYLPAKRFGRCEFGLTAKDRMDCIYCDRCRYDRREMIDEGRRTIDERQETRNERRFMVGVLAVAIFVSAISVNTFLKTVPVGLESATLVSSAGQPRDVDLQRVRSMIEQKQLSDREADFYKKAE